MVGLVLAGNNMTYLKVKKPTSSKTFYLEFKTQEGLDNWKRKEKSEIPMQPANFLIESLGKNTTYIILL